MVLARQNSADEVKPWATISSMAPDRPHWVCSVIDAITRPMWLMEEYAIKDFKSVCCRQVRLARIAPQRARTRNGRNMSVFVVGIVCIIRIMPYPPSFRRIAARTIDPAIGASTCAFGSHRCRPYRGIFVRKASRQDTQSKSSDHKLIGCVIVENGVGVNVRLFINRVVRRRGIEVRRVYSIK